MLTDKPRIPLKEILLYGLLPSPLKKLIYRIRGYRIGCGVSLGLGSVVIGKDVEIGERTSIGFFTVIRGKRIRLGTGVQIGVMSFLDTPHLDLGDGTKINEQVFVGGLQFPDSKLIIGRNCQVMQMTFINPTHTIRIGDDSGDWRQLAGPRDGAPALPGRWFSRTGRCQGAGVSTRGQ